MVYALLRCNDLILDRPILFNQYWRVVKCTPANNAYAQIRNNATAISG